MRNEKSLNVLTQEQKSKYLKEGYLGLSVSSRSVGWIGCES